MDAIRRMQENPELGAFRIHAALEQKRGVEVSPRTVGRVMALHRGLYGLGKPKKSPHQKKAMPFRARRRHEIWTADVRYVDHNLPAAEHEGNVYVISILENYSRAILASAVSRSQDTTAFLRVLYSAVERYGSPETLVTDGGGIFEATQSKAVYAALGIGKEQIERRKPYQSYVETTFNVQRAWPTGTSRGPGAGRSSWPSTTVGLRITTPRDTGRTRTGRTAAIAGGGVGLLHGRSLPSTRPAPRLLLDPPRPRSSRVCQDHDLARLRRGGAGQEGRGAMAR
jgi:hypothetical protein